MTRLIHSYLTGFYRIENGYIQPNHPIRDLSLIFGLSKKQLKYYIKGWVRKQNRGIDFNKCWKGIEFTFLQSVSRPLRYTWTPEMAADLYHHHGIDAEAELTRLFIEAIEDQMAFRIQEIGLNNNMIGNLINYDIHNP